MFFAASLLTLGAVTAAIAGEQAPSGAVRPRVISITAIATDARGRPVASLKPGDFTIRDEGQSLTIESAVFKRGAARLFALFFDEYHIPAGPDTTRAREAIARFVAEQTRAGDRFIAMKPLDPITAIAPSEDRETILRTVETFAGCKDDFTPRTPFEAEYMSRAPQAAAAERSHVVLADLTALVAQLGSVRDIPRAIVFVTEGPGVDLRGAARAAARAGVPVYVIDAGGNGQDASALRALAGDTGATYTASLDMAAQALAGMASDLDAYYVLAFRTSAPADGRFHAIEVATRRPGVQVRAGRGYWSPAPPAVRLTGPDASFPIEDLLTAHVSTLIQPWFRMSRGPQGRTRVTFSWQPGPVSALARLGIPEVVQLTARTPDGTALFRGPVAGSPPPPTDGHDEAPSRVVIDVPPGRLRTEISIAGAGNRVLDRDIRFFEIPNLYASGVTIMTPEILRTRTALEFRQLAQHIDAPPTAVREFNRFERLLIRVRAYGPGDAPPEISATLVNAIGQPLHELARLSEAPEGTTQFDLPLSSLARGNYSIQIAAKSGSARSSQMIPIRVIG